jgi:hypothetical protein
MKKQKKPKKPSWTEVTRTITRQSYVNRATVDIERQREVWSFQAGALEQELSTLVARASEVKKRRAELDAAIAGLNDVIDGR